MATFEYLYSWEFGRVRIVSPKIARKAMALNAWLAIESMDACRDWDYYQTNNNGEIVAVPINEEMEDYDILCELDYFVP